MRLVRLTGLLMEANGRTLARDVTHRDKHGHAEEYYYDGHTDQRDRGERGLWNPKKLLSCLWLRCLSSGRT